MYVNRMKHLICGKPFYEEYGNEIDKCPYCGEILDNVNEVEETVRKEVIIDPMTGELSYETD